MCSDPCELSVRVECSAAMIIFKGLHGNENTKELKLL